MKKPKEAESAQHDSFIKAARELGCDEDEAHFEEKLRKIARQKPRETPNKARRAQATPKTK